jgi:hypothetical protein
MFVSANAVQHFSPHGPPVPPGRPACGGLHRAGHHAALRQAGVPADLVTSPPPTRRSFDSEALWARMPDATGPGRAR